MDLESFGCGVASCTSDPDAILGNMIENRGVFSNEINKSIVGGTAAPFLNAIARTRAPFNGMGDGVETQVVLALTRPNETQVTDWQVVKTASNGYNPCCVQYREFAYGSERVSTCLYQAGWKSPRFCKTDIMLKWKPGEQMQQIVDIMTQWTKDIWSLWTVDAYASTVNTIIASQQWGHPSNVGGYHHPSTGVRPTTNLTINFLDHIFNTVIRPANGPSSRTVEGKELIFISPEAFVRLEEQWLKTNAADFGMRTSGERAPLVNVPGISEVRMIGRYVFSLIEARRFREPLPGESWQDAIVPCRINIPVMDGEKTIANPDYRNPSVAKYEEALWFNDEAAIWKIPPDGLRAGNAWFPPTSFMGDFIPVRPSQECDPFQKSLFFAAEYMSGMMSLYRDRGAAILTLAAHLCHEDVDWSCNEDRPAEPTKHFIKGCCVTMVAGQLQIQTKTAVPANCPPGSGLYLVSQDGFRQYVERGTELIKDGFYYYLIDFPTEDAGNAECRDCDPWDYISCIPLLSTGTCSDGSEPTSSVSSSVSPDTDYIDCVARIADDGGIASVTDSGSRPDVAGGPWTTAAALEASLQTWLDANIPGSTANVEYSDSPEHVWAITLTVPDTTDTSTITVTGDNGQAVLFECCPSE